jgi:hypothetical protein
MKTGEDFKKLARNVPLTWIDVRECSICGSWIGYSLDYGDLTFDSSCDCTSYHSIPQPRSWDDLAGYYNSLPEDHQNRIRLNELFKF